MRCLSANQTVEVHTRARGEDEGGEATVLEAKGRHRPTHDRPGTVEEDLIECF